MEKKKNPELRLALPSKGELEKPTLEFLAASGLKVNRPNERQYVAVIPYLPQVSVLFQRAPDILTKVNEGSVDIGVTGLDILREKGEEYSHTIILYEDLGFGGCELVLAIPESWIDVSSIDDIAELTLDYKEKGKDIRIATKYPNLVKKWLHEKGIIYFTLVEAQGALEAAPGIGYADFIADITSTGTTLRENRLKQISGGSILKSQACLIANRKMLADNPQKLQTTRVILEFIEAQMRARRYISITANIRCDSPDFIVKELNRDRNLAGMRGPTISKVHSKFIGDEDWYGITIVVEQAKLMEAVDHLRKVGGTDVTVFSPKFLFDEKSWSFGKLVDLLRKERD